MINGKWSQDTVLKILNEDIMQNPRFRLPELAELDNIDFSVIKIIGNIIGENT